MHSVEQQHVVVKINGIECFCQCPIPGGSGRNGKMEIDIDMDSNGPLCNSTMYQSARFGDSTLRRRRKPRKDKSGMGLYIKRVLHSMDDYQDMTIAKKSIKVMEDLMRGSIYEPIAMRADLLCKHSHKPTITERTMQLATKEHLPKTLYDHANRQAVESLEKYYQSIGQKKNFQHLLENGGKQYNQQNNQQYNKCN